MKIQLDTIAKTIKVEGSVNFKTLFETLNSILPNKEWESFTLEANTVIHNWSAPIIIEKHVPFHPYSGPWYLHNSGYMGTSGNKSSNELMCKSSTLASGTFNLVAKE